MADVARIPDVARANVARGTTARMRRGSEATWQGRGCPTRGAGGAQDADAWQEAKRSTRVHVGTRWGATWQVGLADGGPTGIVGPGKRVGAVTQLLDICAPLFNRALSTILFRVGLCSHGISLLQVTWPHRTSRIQAQGVDRVDPSPRDHRLQHVRKKIRVSGRDQRAYLMTRGCAMNVRSSLRFHHASSNDRDLLRSRSIARTHLDGPTHLLKIERWIVFNEEPRSTRNCGPIGVRSWRIQRQSGAFSSRNRRHSSSTSSDGL